jgi:glutamyl/glutaminyl-tRNA synthetase
MQALKGEAARTITATAHKPARIVYRLMRYGEAYVNQTEREEAERVRQQQERQLHRRARQMGYELRKIEPPPAA